MIVPMLQGSDCQLWADASVHACDMAADKNPTVRCMYGAVQLLHCCTLVLQSWSAEEEDDVDRPLSLCK